MTTPYTSADIQSDARRSPFAFGWKAIGLRGVLAVALGIVAMLFPFSALFAFTLLFAVYALADGLLSAISAFRRMSDGRHWIAMLLRGLLGIAVGILFAVMPLTMTVTYAVITLFMLAAWAVLAGMLEVAAAIRLRKEIEGEWLLALSGILTIFLGIIVLGLFMTNPTLSILSVGWAIGCYALLSGIALLVLAWRLRRRVQSLRPL